MLPGVAGKNGKGGTGGERDDSTRDWVREDGRWRRDGGERASQDAGFSAI